jgi:hypothetical protein
MSVDGKPRFVSGDIQRHHAATLEAFYKLRRQQALRLIEVPERAKDQTRFDPRGFDALFRGAIDSRNHCLGRESRRGMQQGSETNLRINDPILAQLFKQVFSDEAKGVFTLHQLKSTRGPG